jgi:hypothetical protein
MFNNFTKISNETILGLEKAILNINNGSYLRNYEGFEENLHKYVTGTSNTLVQKETILSCLYQIIIFDNAYLGDNYKWADQMSQKIVEKLLVYIDSLNYKQYFNELLDYSNRLIKSETHPIVTINKVIKEMVNDYTLASVETLRILKNNILVRSDNTPFGKEYLGTNIDEFLSKDDFEPSEKGAVLETIYQLIVMQYVETAYNLEELIDYVIGNNLKYLDKANFKKYFNTISTYLSDYKIATLNPSLEVNKRLENNQENK